jgi:hypothetical protein
MSIQVTLINYFRRVNVLLMSFFRRLNVRSLLAFAGMAGPVVLITCDFTAAFTSPGYNMVKNSISSLALTQLGWLVVIGFLAIGLLIEIFTAGLLFNIKPCRRFYMGIAIFVFFGFGMLLIGAFRTDPVGGEHTFEGMIHGYAATAAFILFPLAILLMSRSIKTDPNWRHLFRYTEVTGALAILLVILIKVLDDHIDWFGLLERLLVANMIIWVEVAAINLLILSIRLTKKEKSNIEEWDNQPSQIDYFS